MRVDTAYGDDLAEYRFPGEHPLKPERFTLTMLLAREWGLIADPHSEGFGTAVVSPQPLPDAELELVHAPEFLAATREAGSSPGGWHGGFGIGPGDTPPFRDMHRIAALVCGATSLALERVLDRACDRAFSPAGGLHHAHADRAAGFCVFNDPAVATALAIARRPGLRIAYVDLDAHHGDGVQEAFYDRADVLTVSVHESGRYLYPGSGGLSETGVGDGVGFALNLPFPPGANDACYALALEHAVAPALRVFAPDAMVLQLGADSHRDDPLAHLDTTVAGQHASAVRLIALADELCAGRVVATGGGGYDAFSAVPRAWACVLAALLGVRPPDDLPPRWLAESRALSGPSAALPRFTFDEVSEPAPVGIDVLAETERVVARARAEHPLLRGC